MRRDRCEILHGTPDLMIPRSLQSMGPLHGWGIARRIEQVGEDSLFFNQGTVYPALVWLEQAREADDWRMVKIISPLVRNSD